MNSFERAASQIRTFGEAMSRSIEAGARSLAPADDPAESVEWSDDGRNTMHVTIQLRSGRVIRGAGPSKLDALADAEARLTA